MHDRLPSLSSLARRLLGLAQQLHRTLAATMASLVLAFMSLLVVVTPAQAAVVTVNGIAVFSGSDFCPNIVNSLYACDTSEVGMPHTKVYDLGAGTLVDFSTGSYSTPLEIFTQPGPVTISWSAAGFSGGVLNALSGLAPDNVTQYGTVLSGDMAVNTGYRYDPIITSTAWDITSMGASYQLHNLLTVTVRGPINGSSGGDWDLRYTAHLNTANPGGGTIPEPGSMALVALALVCIVGARRWRQA